MAGRLWLAGTRALRFNCETSGLPLPNRCCMDIQMQDARCKMQDLTNQINYITSKKFEDLPLYGVPFVVKDSIDLASTPTTAGCPAFAYTPSESVLVVQRLLVAGTICIGKANLNH